MIELLCSCTVSADIDKPKSNDISLYYSFKTCEYSGECEVSLPSSKLGEYIFRRLEPAHDEFYLKKDKMSIIFIIRIFIMKMFKWDGLKVS